MNATAGFTAGLDLDSITTSGNSSAFATNLATVAASYQQVLAGGPADMTITDPPYSVNYEGKTKKKLKLQNDNLGIHFEGFLRDACANPPSRVN